MYLTPQEYHDANLSDDSLELADGSGYLAEMAVYHELHCIVSSILSHPIPSRLHFSLLVCNS